MSDSLQRRIGLGVKLSADETSPGNFVQLGAVVEGFDHSGAKKTVADGTILTDTYGRIGAGQIAPGEYTLMIAYDPGANTTAARLKTMLEITGFDAGTNFQIQYPITGTENAAVNKTFLGYVTNLGLAVKRDKLITQSVTISVDGSPGF